MDNAGDREACSAAPGAARLRRLAPLTGRWVGEQVERSKDCCRGISSPITDMSCGGPFQLRTEGRKARVKPTLHQAGFGHSSQALEGRSQDVHRLSVRSCRSGAPDAGMENTLVDAGS